MGKIRKFQGCKPGEKLYFDWANQATLECDILAAGDETAKREARAKTMAAFQAWKEHERDCAQCAGYKG